MTSFSVWNFSFGVIKDAFLFSCCKLKVVPDLNALLVWYVIGTALVKINM